MKAETYILLNKDVQKNAMARMFDVELNGRVKVTFSNAGSKKQNQRGLQYLWYSDIAKSGVGGEHEDTKEGVHLVCKYRFAVPILMRDDSDFRALWNGILKACNGDKKRIEYAVQYFVSTEKEGFNMPEYLSDIERFYISKGVRLTDPKDRGIVR